MVRDDYHFFLIEVAEDALCVPGNRPQLMNRYTFPTYKYEFFSNLLLHLRPGRSARHFDQLHATSVNLLASRRPCLQFSPNQGYGIHRKV